MKALNREPHFDVICAHGQNVIFHDKPISTIFYMKNTEFDDQFAVQSRLILVVQGDPSFAFVSRPHFCFRLGILTLRTTMEAWLLYHGTKCQRIVYDQGHTDFSG